MDVIRSPVGFHCEIKRENYTIRLSLTKIKETDQHISGILSVKAGLKDKWYSLHIGRFTITSAQSRKHTSNHINQIVKQTVLERESWDILLEKFSNEVYKIFYEPKTAERLQPTEINPSIPYLLYPLLPEKVPTLIFAPGGVGKSLIALYIAILVQSGYTIDYKKVEPKNVLYVDWELDKSLMNIRYNQITSDKIENKCPPLYYSASHKLSDEIADILTNIQQNDVKLVIMDSAGMAIGGDINDASAVINFYEEIRKITNLGVTVLILTHVAKAEKSKEDESNPIGSVFFENLSRSTWELKSWKNPSQDMSYIYALYNRKNNFGKKNPIGFKVTWEDNIAFIETTDLDFEETITGSTQNDTVLMVLKENGPMTVKAMSAVTGIAKNNLWVILSNLKKQGLVKNNGNGEWQTLD